MRAGGLEVALVGALLGSFLTIPVYWSHLTFGVAFVLLASVHIGRRRRVYLAVLRRRRRRAVVSAVLVASAVVMTASGVVQWAGVAAAIPWHGASSMVLILLGARHAIRRVRAGRLVDCRVGQSKPLAQAVEHGDEFTYWQVNRQARYSVAQQHPSAIAGLDPQNSASAVAVTSALGGYPWRATPVDRLINRVHRIKSFRAGLAGCQYIWT